MLLDKPVIFYSPITKVYSDQLDVENIKLMQQGSFVARTTPDIRNIFIQLSDQTLKSAERSYVSKKCFSNYGTATKDVLCLIKKQLCY
jgi:hypothetical protein